MSNTFATECDVIRLFYENAEAEIINDFFYETSDNDQPSIGKQIAEKVSKKVSEIIEKIKEFFQQIRKKHEAAKVRAMLRSECARSKRLIKAEIHDKEILARVSQVYKIEQKAFAELQKAYGSFMQHKIDYDTLCKKIDKVTADVNEAMDRIEDKYGDMRMINPNSIKGQYTIAEITKRVGAVEQKYSQALDQMEKAAIAEENKLQAVAKNAATDNSSSAATTKTSAAISKINKKVVSEIIALVGIVSAATLCYKLGSSNAGYKPSAKMESVEDDSSVDDYFAGFFEEDNSYGMNEDISENLFEDLL